MRRGECQRSRAFGLIAQTHDVPYDVGVGALAVRPVFVFCCRFYNPGGYVEGHVFEVLVGDVKGPADGAGCSAHWRPREGGRASTQCQVLLGQTGEFFHTVVVIVVVNVHVRVLSDFLHRAVENRPGR